MLWLTVQKPAYETRRPSSVTLIGDTLHFCRSVLNCTHKTIFKHATPLPELIFRGMPILNSTILLLMTGDFMTSAVFSYR